MWVSELMKANMLGGKLVRGITGMGITSRLQNFSYFELTSLPIFFSIAVVRSFQQLIWENEKRQATSEEIRKASVVGWGLGNISFLLENF
tara:strand:- start:586 stop:855 length:270 start_codon:yes stop_codon:yes gene_type:complete